MEETIRQWLFDPTVGRFVTVVVGLFVIRFLVGVAQRSLGQYVQQTEVRYRTRKFATVLGYVCGFLFITVVYSDRLGGLTVAFGVAGAGIAFALQEVIVSVAGWIALSFGKLYNVGDRVQVAGIRGDVIDIGVLRTTLMELGQWVNGDQYNGRIVRVANSYVFKEPVFNYSGDFPFLWDEIMVPIKYGSDYREAREIIKKVAQEVVGEYASGAAEAWRGVVSKYMIENARVEPMVTMIANQNWIEFTLRYVVDFKLRRVTKDRLFTRILEEVDQTEDRVGIAASTLNIEKLAPLEVHLANEIRVRGSAA